MGREEMRMTGSFLVSSSWSTSHTGCPSSPFSSWSSWGSGVGREEECACPAVQCRGWSMQVKTCSVGLARLLSLINEQEMFLEGMVEQPNTVSRELRLASVADRCECRSVWTYPPGLPPIWTTSSCWTWLDSYNFWKLQHPPVTSTIHFLV